MTLEPGLSARIERRVTPELTARAFGSGLVNGLATPMMIALMEQASVEAVAPELEEGQSTVGTKLDVTHLAPTPVGMLVRVRAELEEVDRRRLVFSVVAEDEVGEIGSGRHERFIIELSSFEEKIAARGN